MPKKRSTPKREHRSNRPATSGPAVLTTARDLWGHKQAWALTNRLRHEGTFPQAMLIVGPAGVGKAAFAQLLARALICTNHDQAPCGTCIVCRDVGAQTGHFIHLNETEEVNIDSLRELQKRSHLRAFDGGRMVILVTDTDRLSEGAWNSLLKFLEEPPAELTILLTACDERSVPATVRSRTAILRLHPIAAATLRTALTTLGLPNEQITYAISRSNGLPGRVAVLLTELGAGDQRTNEKGAGTLSKAQTVTERWQALLELAGSAQPTTEHVQSVLDQLEQADHVTLSELLAGRGDAYPNVWTAMLKRRRAHRLAHAAARRNSSPTSILFSLAQSA